MKRRSRAERPELHALGLQPLADSLAQGGAFLGPELRNPDVQFADVQLGTGGREGSDERGQVEGRRVGFGSGEDANGGQGGHRASGVVSGAAGPNLQTRAPSEG